MELEIMTPMEKPIYIACDLLFITFLVSILKPLWQLASGRIALFILFSKSIASLCNLLLRIVCITLNALVHEWWCSQYTGAVPTWYRIAAHLLWRFLDYCVYFHILALAWNRLHGACFPFHYNCWLKKRRIFLLCTFIWSLALFCTLVNALIYLDDWLKPLDGLLYKILITCITTAGFAYVLLALRLIWMKWHTRNSVSSTTAAARPPEEKNYVKVAVAFAFSLSLMVLNQYAVFPLADLVVYNKPPDWPQWTLPAMNWATELCYLTSFIAEELFLLLLIKDFRLLVIAHFRSSNWLFFCCCCNKSGQQNLAPTIGRQLRIPIEQAAAVSVATSSLPMPRNIC